MSRFAPKKYRPHRTTVKNLKFTRAYRCDGLNCGVIYKSKAPAQCACGSISFEHFHSYGEACRYATLLLLQSRGKISNLRKQVRFPLYTVGPEGLQTKVCDYIADFEYDDDKGKRVVEEFKGGMTDVASLKMKWFKAQYGFEPLYTKGN